MTHKQYFCVVSLKWKCKSPLLGVVAIIARGNLTPVWSHVGNQLPCFQQATCPTSYPSLPLFTIQACTSTQFFTIKMTSAHRKPPLCGTKTIRGF